MRPLGIIIAIICFMLMVISHEFGHFASAKLLGVRVNEFSVGMGPKIWSKKKGETQYSLRAVPLGGYCMLEGEDGDSTDERAFSKQPLWSRILILLAGAFMNIVMAILVLTIIFTKVGAVGTTLDQVNPDGPAYEAGIRAGDKIIGIDGVYYDNWQDISAAIASSSDELSITYIRNGVENTATTHKYDLGDGRTGVGIVASIEHSLLASFKEGVYETGSMALAIRDFIVTIFSGDASINDVSSVVGIVSMAGDAAEVGLINVFYIMALISANLGYMNLLPLPALDGGRILMAIICAISRGKISEETEGVIHAIGMVLLIILMLIIMFKDTISLFIH